MRAIALEVNGEVVAFGGVMRRDHRLVAFMEMKSDAPNIQYPWSGLHVRPLKKLSQPIPSRFTRSLMKNGRALPGFWNIAALSIVEYRKISRSLEE